MLLRTQLPGFLLLATHSRVEDWQGQWQFSSKTLKYIKAIPAVNIERVVSLNKIIMHNKRDLKNASSNTHEHPVKHLVELVLSICHF